MSARKRYVVCGVSARGINMFITPIMRDFNHCAEFVGMLDIDPLRFEVCKHSVPEAKDVPGYMPGDFDKMINECKPDAVIVTGMDCTHVDYIIRALARDLEVICEKPMTTNTADALRVIEAEKNSKGRVICTFNYRYSPIHRKIREMIVDGKIGRVTHVDLNWYIDVRHGASYFRRWNRMRENSGSLSIHKSSHHFDLVNWWVDGIPEVVHAFGALNHYGPDAPLNPSKKSGRNCTKCPERTKCAYTMRWNTRNSTMTPPDDHINVFEGGSKKYSNYSPQMCIFDPEINIHDTYITNVKYHNGVLLNYSANFSTPYEGYHLAINGTLGRLESYQFGGSAGADLPNPNNGDQFIDFFPMFEGRERINVVKRAGSHGGGDPLIREDIFLGEDPDRKFDVLAKSINGLRAIAVGDAVFNSIQSGEIQDLRSFIL